MYFLATCVLEEKGKLEDILLSWLKLEQRYESYIRLEPQKLVEAKTEKQSSSRFLRGLKSIKSMYNMGEKWGNGMGESKEYYCLLSPHLECDLVSLHCSASSHPEH